MFICGRRSDAIAGRHYTGRSLAMPFFALASVPLIKAVAVANGTQDWFADDAGSGSKLLSLKDWWDRLLQLGPRYGYFPNPEK